MSPLREKSGVLEGHLSAEEPAIRYGCINQKRDSSFFIGKCEKALFLVEEYSEHFGPRQSVFLCHLLRATVWEAGTGSWDLLPVLICIFKQ